MIKKNNAKAHSRAHISEDLNNSPESNAEPPPPSTSASSAAALSPGQGDHDEMDIEDKDEDELTVLRKLLRPPDIPGVKDWGIPPESDKACDPAIATKLLQFHALKSGPTPKHFNDSLMSNQSFHNPHLYAKLVEFADIGDESVSCYHHHASSPSAWDGLFGHGEEYWDWDAEKIAQSQKARDQAQPSHSQRKQIDFTSARHKDSRSSHATRGGKEKDKIQASRYNPYIPDRSGQKWQGRWG